MYWSWKWSAICCICVSFFVFSSNKFQHNFVSSVCNTTQWMGELTVRNFIILSVSSRHSYEYGVDELQSCVLCRSSTHWRATDQRPTDQDLPTKTYQPRTTNHELPSKNCQSRLTKKYPNKHQTCCLKEFLDPRKSGRYLHELYKTL